MSYFLGIDGRSDQISAVLFDENGNVIAGESVRDFARRDNIIFECELPEFWTAAATAVRQVIKSARIMPEMISAIGLTGESEGLCLIDDNGRPIFPMVSCHDLRAEEEARNINEKTPGIGKLVHRTLGKKIDPGSTLILLKWLKSNHLTVYNKIDRILFAKDWLRYCMTGKIATEYSEIGGTFFKFKQSEIPQQLFTVLGIPEIAAKIPEVFHAAEWVGTLTTEAADQAGLLPGIPVAVGLGSTAASLLGLGSHTPGNFSVFMNDSCQIAALANRSDCDPGKYWNHFVADFCADQAIEILNTFDGIKNIKWIIRTLLGEADRNNKTDEILSSAQPGCGGLIYHPYPSRDGSGGFFGMNYQTTQADMLRAVYESIAYSIKECYDTTQQKDALFINGGNSVGPVLPQIIADVVGKKVICAPTEHIAAKGAAMCAAVAVSEYSSIEAVSADWCQSPQIYEPNHLDVYDRNFELFKSVKKNITPLWQMRNEILKDKNE